MKYRFAKELYSEAQIHDKVKELAARITEDYSGQELICVCVLKGATVFMTDLIREIGEKVNVKMDFLAISSYGDSTVSSGKVNVQKDMSMTIGGKNVLVIEDILDSGLSLTYLRNMLMLRNPKSLEICVMFDKTACHKMDVNPKYVGFEIPDSFVVGYGLDYAECFRNLKSLKVLELIEE